MSAVLRPAVSPEEWKLRVRLAGAYRVAHECGWSELIYTHISARVPGREHHFLINPYGLRFDEVTASSLIKVNQDGETVGPHEYAANKAGFIIHSAIHMAREDAHAVMHLHTPAGQAVEELRLGPGDAISFESTTPHRYRNDGTEPAVGVWYVAGQSVQ